MGGGTIRPGAGDALILVDVQKDFLPGGSLAVPRGDEVVPVLNRYLAVFRSLALPVVATRDWHPPDHCSSRRGAGRGRRTASPARKARASPPCWTSPPRA